MARTVTDLAILLDAMIPSESRHANHPSNFTQSTLKPQENVNIYKSITFYHVYYEAVKRMDTDISLIFCTLRYHSELE